MTKKQEFLALLKDCCDAKIDVEFSWDCDTDETILRERVTQIETKLLKMAGIE